MKRELADALIIAAKNGNNEVVKKLIDDRAYLNGQDCDGETALIYAQLLMVILQ